MAVASAHEESVFVTSAHDTLACSPDPPMAQSPTTRADRRPPSPGPLSYEAFLAWADEDTRAEWVGGEVSLMSPASTRHQDIADFFTAASRTCCSWRATTWIACRIPTSTGRRTWSWRSSRLRAGRATGASGAAAGGALPARRRSAGPVGAADRRGSLRVGRRAGDVAARGLALAGPAAQGTRRRAAVGRRGMTGPPPRIESAGPAGRPIFLSDSGFVAT